MLFLSWLINACDSVVVIARDLKTILQSLSSSYTIALECFLLLWNAFETSFHILFFYCRWNVDQVFSQFYLLDEGEKFQSILEFFS